MGYRPRTPLPVGAKADGLVIFAGQGVGGWGSAYGMRPAQPRQAHERSAVDRSSATALGGPYADSTPETRQDEVSIDHLQKASEIAAALKVRGFYATAIDARRCQDFVDLWWAHTRPARCWASRSPPRLIGTTGTVKDGSQ
jgi:hypothetical protein